MTLPAFAEIEELVDRIPDGIEVEDYPRAQAALADASSLIRSEAGATVVATWIASDELTDAVPEIIKTVTLRSALRVFVNPTEETQSTTGPYSSSRVANAYLTATEKAMIARAAGRVSGIGVITTTRGEIETRLVGCRGDVAEEYLAVEPAGEDIPYL